MNNDSAINMDEISGIYSDDQIDQNYEGFGDHDDTLHQEIQQVLDGIDTSGDRRGKNNLEKILEEDQDIYASNSTHCQVDPMLQENDCMLDEDSWIPVVTRSKRKVKPTFKMLSMISAKGRHSKCLQ